MNPAMKIACLVACALGIAALLGLIRGPLAAAAARA